MRFTIKEFLKSRFQYPVYFYKYIGRRLFLLVLLIIFVGLLDGLGLTMFLPLLQMVDGSIIADAQEFGKLRFIFDAITDMGLMLNLKVVLSLMTLFFIIKGLIVYIGNAYRISVQQYFVKKVRLEMLSSLSAISYKSFMVSDMGRIQNTMSAEVGRLSMSLTAYLQAAQNVILSIVYLSFAIVLNTRFSLLVVVGAVLVNFIFRRLYKKTKATSKSLTSDTHKYQGWLIQFITSFKYLRATGTIGKLKDKLKVQILNIERNNKKLGILTSIMTSFREPSMIIIVAVAIFIQVSLLGSSLSSILVSLLFFYRALSTIITVQNHWNTFLSLSGSVDNIQAFQKELAQNYEPKGQIEIKNVTTAVELKDIVLELGNAKILNNISLILNKNETIALVGESGSGKTSLVNLITTLFHPDQGIMLIDGKDIKSLDLGSYQTQIGYITQDPVIFTASIYDNISFWDEKNEDNLLRFNEAVKRAAIFEFIETLPEKEMTELGLGGINLSGGQKQRINIARELYKNPSILIFDEATSSLDTETENLIKSNIEDLHGHCTIIIIAHRLSTIRNADRIIILHQGRISGEGTFDELLKTNERFRHMIKLQEF